MYTIMKKCIKSDVKEIVLKLLANDRSDKRFLLSSKFCPLGLRLEVQEILFKLETNNHSDEAFSLTSKFWP